MSQTTIKLNQKSTAEISRNWGNPQIIWKLNKILLENCKPKKSPEKLENIFNRMKMKTPQTHQNVWKVVKAVLGRTLEFYMLILERKNKINN